MMYVCLKDKVWTLQYEDCGFHDVSLHSLKEAIETTVNILYCL